MRNLVIILCLCFASSDAEAQAFFNKRTTLHSYYSLYTNVVEHKGIFYTIGISLDSLNLDSATQLVRPNDCIRLSKWSLQGDLIKDTLYQKVFYQIETWDATLHFLSDSTLLLASYLKDTA